MKERLLSLGLAIILLLGALPATTSAAPELTYDAMSRFESGLPPEAQELMNNGELKPGDLLRLGAKIALYQYVYFYDQALIGISQGAQHSSKEIVIIGDCLQFVEAKIIYADGTVTEGIHEIFLDGERMTLFVDHSKDGMLRENYMSFRIVTGKKYTYLNEVYDHEPGMDARCTPEQASESHYKPTRKPTTSKSVYSIIDHWYAEWNGIYTKPETLPPNPREPKLALNKSTVSLEIGRTSQLKTTVNPSDTTVKWKSSDTTVATVSAKGVITALKSGKTTITATGNNGLSATCDITVWTKSVTFNTTKKTIKAGGTFTLVPTISPNQKSNILEWSSNNPAVAEVDSSGKVATKKAGTARISLKVTFKDGKQKSALCIVTVTKK